MTSCRGKAFPPSSSSKGTRGNQFFLMLPKSPWQAGNLPENDLVGEWLPFTQWRSKSTQHWWGHPWRQLKVPNGDTGLSVQWQLGHCFHSSSRMQQSLVSKEVSQIGLWGHSYREVSHSCYKEMHIQPPHLFIGEATSITSPATFQESDNRMQN